MITRIIIMITALLVVFLQACKWNDDFRSKEQPGYLQQPQYIEPPPRPTLYIGSEDYKGDDTHETEDIERLTEMPAIDDREPIPPIQEFTVVP